MNAEALVKKLHKQFENGTFDTVHELIEHTVGIALKLGSELERKQCIEAIQSFAEDSDWEETQQAAQQIRDTVSALPLLH
jgi:hypothetical protein